MAFAITLSIGDDAAPIRNAILSGLSEYNARFLGPGASRSVGHRGPGEDGTIVGGVAGRVWHDRLFADFLWVDEVHRHRGLGSAILSGIEAEARTRGATRVLLDTFSFQAAPFYERQGYREVARLPRFLGEHDRIYLEKDL